MQCKAGVTECHFVCVVFVIFLGVWEFFVVSFFLLRVNGRDYSLLLVAVVVVVVVVVVSIYKLHCCYSSLTMKVMAT